MSDSESEENEDEKDNEDEGSESSESSEENNENSFPIVWNPNNEESQKNINLYNNIYDLVIILYLNKLMI